MRPVGPHSPGVYWFRRLLVLVVVLLVIALVWWLFFKDDGSEPAAPVAAPTTSSPTPSPTPTPTKTRTPKTTEPAAPLCEDDAIEVTVETDETSYPPDQEPTFTLAVKNTSAKACSRDVGQSALELRVSSGGQLVWSSDHCNPGGEERIQTLEPDDRFVQSVEWARATSAEGCPTPADSAEAGDYQVVARNLEIISEPAAFTLQ